MAETTGNDSSNASSNASTSKASNASNDDDDSDDASMMRTVLDAVARARLALRGTRERARGRGGWTTTTRDVRRAVRERREEAMRACVRGIREGTRDESDAARRGAREERDVLRACARGAREARTIGAMALMRMVESGEPTRSLDAMREEREGETEETRRRAARVEKTAREIEARTPRVVEDVERACGSERCVREAFEGAREEARRAFEGEREVRARAAKATRARARDAEETIDRIVETRVGPR
tara:strand:- start:10217 stop:10948 length:732 start_codon:yes stop_codon:yes gene_type:complete